MHYVHVMTLKLGDNPILYGKLCIIKLFTEIFQVKRLAGFENTLFQFKRINAD